MIRWKKLQEERSKIEYLYGGPWFYAAGNQVKDEDGNTVAECNHIGMPNEFNARMIAGLPDIVLNWTMLISMADSLSRLSKDANTLSPALKTVYQEALVLMRKLGFYDQ